MTYEFTPVLVVTVAAARRTTVNKIKPLQVCLHIFTNISQQSVRQDFIRCS